jgi:hypothetical protein
LALLESARKADYKDISTHLILENNIKMRAEFERLHVPYHQKYRVFRKEI